MKKWKCTISVAKTKAQISFAVTAKLICVFVFAYADCLFSHEAAQVKDWPSTVVQADPRLCFRICRLLVFS